VRQRQGPPLSPLPGTGRRVWEELLPAHRAGRLRASWPGGARHTRPLLIGEGVLMVWSKAIEWLLVIVLGLLMVELAAPIVGW